MGSNVVATGAVDLTGLSFITTGSGCTLYVDAQYADLATGQTNSNCALYSGGSFVSSFGAGGNVLTNTGSGDYVALSGHISSTQAFNVPIGYSGGALSSTATWNNQTLAGLGLNPGIYSSTWDSGNGNFIVEIGIPEPSTFWLLTLPLTAMLVRSRIGIRANLSRRSKLARSIA